MLRLVGLLGVALGIVVGALAERLEKRKGFITAGAVLALFSAAIYFLGVFAVAEPGASRFLPRFP